jgi:hypothetical protein
MNVLTAVKKTVKYVVAAGTAKIVHDLIKNNVDTETIPNKVMVTSASFAIGAAVGEIAGDYTDKQIDEMIDLFKNIRNRQNTTESED